MPSPQMLGDNTLSISLKAKGIGEVGMLGIGWGGVKMYDAQVRYKAAARKRLTRYDYRRVLR